MHVGVYAGAPIMPLGHAMLDSVRIAKEMFVETGPTPAIAKGPSRTQVKA